MRKLPRFKTKSLRKSFFATLSSLLFLAAVIFALLLVRGNTITPDGITETGTLRLNISPESSFEVFLNEQRQSVTSNRTVDNVAPGEYLLRITANGYTAWQQDISVRAGLVTDVAVRLFPESLKLQQLSKTNISYLAFSPTRRQAYYVVRDFPLGGNIGIWQQNLVKSNIPLVDEQPVKISNLTPEVDAAMQAGKLEIIPALNGDKFLLILDGQIHLLDSNRYNEPTPSNRLNFDYDVQSIEWLKDGSNLLIASDNLLVDYEISTGKQTLIVFHNDAPPVYTRQLNTVVFSSNDKLHRYTDGMTSEITLENVRLPADISQLHASQDNPDHLILTASTGLYFLYIPESFLENLGQVSLLSVTPTGRNLFVRTGDNSIVAVQVDISLIRNTVEHVERTVSLPSNILFDGLLWDANSSYILFQTASEPTAIYSADRNGNNIKLILQSDSLLGSGLYNIVSDGSAVNVLLTDNELGEDPRANLYELRFVL